MKLLVTATLGDQSTTHLFDSESSLSSVMGVLCFRLGLYQVEEYPYHWMGDRLVMLSGDQEIQTVSTFCLSTASHQAIVFTVRPY